MAKTKPGAADGEVERETPVRERTFVDELRPEVKRRQWVLQRAIWLVMAAIIALAFFGVFGNGPLSKTEARASTSGGEVELSYSRFARQKSPQQMDIRVTATSAEAASFRLIVPYDTQSTMRIDVVTPEPEAMVLAAEGAVYEWPLAGPGEFLVTVRYEALRWRRIEMTLGVQVGLTQASTVDMTQWVYP